MILKLMTQIWQKAILFLFNKIFVLLVVCNMSLASSRGLLLSLCCFFALTEEFALSYFNITFLLKVWTRLIEFHIFFALV